MKPDLSLVETPIQAELAEGNAKSATKTVSDYRARFPAHTNLCLTDTDVRLRLKQVLNVSELFLQLYTTVKPKNNLHEFFSRNITNRIMFFVLAKGATATLLGDDRSQALNNDAIGVPVGDVISAMTKAEGKSIRACEMRLIEALDMGFCFASPNRYDERQRMIWINPQMLNNFLIGATQMLDKIFVDNNFVGLRKKIDQRTSEDPEWHDKLSNRLIGALKINDNYPQ